VTVADANRTRFARNPTVADINIGAASGEIGTRRFTQGNVIATGRVTKERFDAVGRVGVAGSIAKERRTAVGGVVVAGCIVAIALTPVPVLKMPVVLLLSA
jgi:hypothetical protein